MPSDKFQLAGSLRVDGDIRVETGSGELSNVGMPVQFTAGMVFRPQLAVRWSASFHWRGWGSASDDLTAIGLGQSFDTWEIGSGIEIGGGGPGTSPVPIRSLAFFMFRFASFTASAMRSQTNDM